MEEVSVCMLTLPTELRAREMTGSAIRVLLGLAHKTARLIAGDGTEKDVSLSAILVGDRLLIRPGEKVPSMACG
jgi:Cu+-exporting ATPase